MTDEALANAVHRMGGELRTIGVRVTTLEENLTSHDRSLAVGENRLNHLESMVQDLGKTTGILHMQLDKLTDEVLKISPRLSDILQRHEIKEQEMRISDLKSVVDGYKSEWKTIRTRLFNYVLAALGVLFVAIVGEKFPSIMPYLKGIFGFVFSN